MALLFKQPIFRRMFVAAWDSARARDASHVCFHWQELPTDSSPLLLSSAVQMHSTLIPVRSSAQPLYFGSMCSSACREDLNRYTHEKDQMIFACNFHIFSVTLKW
jgi:hypothetical protein